MDPIGGQPSIEPVGPLEGNDGLGQTDQKQYMDRGELLSVPLNYSPEENLAKREMNPTNHQAVKTPTTTTPMPRLQLEKILRLAVRTIGRAPN